MKVTTDAVQVLGGNGYTRDFRVERYMREAKITQIFEGTNQIQRLVISRALAAADAPLPLRVVSGSLWPRIQLRLSWSRGSPHAARTSTIGKMPRRRRMLTLFPSDDRMLTPSPPDGRGARRPWRRASRPLVPTGFRATGGTTPRHRVGIISMEFSNNRCGPGRAGCRESGCGAV